jgi:hypothetical protein
MLGMAGASPVLLTVGRLALALGMLAGARNVGAQHTTVCATDQLDWYTSVVGETPCRTYERLRQTCDSRCAYTPLVART